MDRTYVIYTDGVGGSFSEYCHDLPALVRFIRNLPSNYRINAITKSI